MAEKLRIYTLDNLTPEVKAVCFAKCSRSPESFDEIAKELTEEKSSKFHEKWVVGYGHSSVAEHAVLSIAMENVSILATKVIEDNRLCSFTEKSTRYQVFDRDKYLKPKNLMDSPLGKIYEKAGNYLFDTYAEMTPIVMDYVKKKFPKTDPSILDKIYETSCKSKVCDIIRYLLPVSTLTNLGWTVNARNLEYAVSKMLSNPLEEIQEIGQKVKKAALKITPTLIKYADFNKYLSETPQVMERDADKYLKMKVQNKKPVTLVDYDRQAENKLVAALLYRFSSYPYAQVFEKVKSMSQKIKAKVIDDALKNRGSFDAPLRELEHVYYSFDILMDYGAFRDIQRHRLCTQTNQLVTTDHGYDIPEQIIELGLKDKFVSAMEASADAYNKIVKKFPYEAQYIVALAYKKRTLFTWNLRELHHFISLRSKPMGHISYRRIANQIYDEIERVHPLLAKYIRVTKVAK